MTHMLGTDTRRARLTAVVRMGWGALLLTAPETLLAATGRPSRGTPVMIARLLGARHVLQAAVTAVRPTAMVASAGSASDALHALTGLALALVSGRWRRVACADALVATGFAVAGRPRVVVSGEQ